MTTLQQRHNQAGAVSLFVVIFATLLMIVITLSFIQLMIKDQRQATASDLSQSAYDSAQSGVEDAKRLLLLHQSCRNGTALPSVNCGAIDTAVASDACDTVSRIFGKVGDTETVIEQDEGDAALQQAYTCVKIKVATADYGGNVGINQSDIIPLKGVTDFDSVRISWFTREDVSAATNSMAVGFPSCGSGTALPRLGNCWSANTPALLRTQLMQSGSSFALTDYDASAPGRTNASTLFLYPASAGSSNLSFALDARRDPTATPQETRCVNNFSLGEYACGPVTITLPAPMDGDVVNRNAFLRLSALYNGATYKVELLKAGSVVLFDNVQPEVDSTGRANDMFRRVKNRVEFKGDFIYPEAAVDIDGDLCKNFTITDRDSDYVNNSPSCNVTP